MCVRDQPSRRHPLSCVALLGSMGFGAVIFMHHSSRALVSQFESNTSNSLIYSDNSYSAPIPCKENRDCLLGL